MHPLISEHMFRMMSYIMYHMLGNVGWWHTTSYKDHFSGIVRCPSPKDMFNCITLLVHNWSLIAQTDKLHGNTRFCVWLWPAPIHGPVFDFTYGLYCHILSWLLVPHFVKLSLIILHSAGCAKNRMTWQWRSSPQGPCILKSNYRKQEPHGTVYLIP